MLECCVLQLAVFSLLSIFSLLLVMSESGHLFAVICVLLAVIIYGF